MLYELLSSSEFVVELYVKLIAEMEEIWSRNVLQLSSHNPPLASNASASLLPQFLSHRE